MPYPRNPSMNLAWEEGVLGQMEERLWAQFRPSLQIHRLRGRSGAWRVLPQRLSPMRGRGSRSDCLRGMLSSLSFEDLPPSGVFIIRDHLHYLFPFVKGAEIAASTRARGMAATGGGELGGWLGECWVGRVDGVMAD